MCPKLLLLIIVIAVVVLYFLLRKGGRKYGGFIDIINLDNGGLEEYLKEYKTLNIKNLPEFTTAVMHQLRWLTITPIVFQYFRKDKQFGKEVDLSKEILDPNILELVGNNNLIDVSSLLPHIKIYQEEPNIQINVKCKGDCESWTEKKGGKLFTISDKIFYKATGIGIALINDNMNVEYKSFGVEDLDMPEGLDSDLRVKKGEIIKDMLDGTPTIFLYENGSNIYKVNFIKLLKRTKTGQESLRTSTNKYSKQLEDGDYGEILWAKNPGLFIHSFKNQDQSIYDQELKPIGYDRSTIANNPYYKYDIAYLKDYINKTDGK